MKVEVLSKKVILERPGSVHNYSAWPTVTRLPGGALAMVASSFRVNHICPFGKCVISYSFDEGEHWTAPAPVIDTLLDDRDGGIAVFGEKNVIVTSFNNTVAMQRDMAGRNVAHCAGQHRAYVNSYLDILEAKHPDWKKDLGSTFTISTDGGFTFGEIKHIPVTCPHGPAPMPDGTLLYVGRKFAGDDSFAAGENHLAAYKLYADGSYTALGEIENIAEDLLSCEPHTVVLPDGKILVHIRVQNRADTVFTIYQSESTDGGRCFTRPHKILADHGGAPSHLLLDGDTLIATYGYRDAPFGIRAMFSRDGGETWDTDHVLVDDGVNWDLGYPASVVLSDGSILTVYYAKREKTTPGVIYQVIWRYC